MSKGQWVLEQTSENQKVTLVERGKSFVTLLFGDLFY